MQRSIRGGSSGRVGAAGSGYAAGRVQRRPVVRSRCRRGRRRDRRDVGGRVPRGGGAGGHPASRGRASRRGRPAGTRASSSTRSIPPSGRSTSTRSAPTATLAADGELDFRLPAEPAGLLLVSLGTAGPRRIAADLAALWPAFEPEYVGPDDLRRLEPALAPGLAACRLRIGLPVPPAAATRAFARLAERRGARVQVGRSVTGLARSGDRVTGVRLSDGTTIPAGAVLVAAGPWSPELLDPERSVAADPAQLGRRRRGRAGRPAGPRPRGGRDGRGARGPRRRARRGRRTGSPAMRPARRRPRTRPTAGPSSAW